MRRPKITPSMVSMCLSWTRCVQGPFASVCTLLMMYFQQRSRDNSIIVPGGIGLFAQTKSSAYSCSTLNEDTKLAACASLNHLCCHSICRSTSEVPMPHLQWACYHLRPMLRPAGAAHHCKCFRRLFLHPWIRHRTKS